MQTETTKGGVRIDRTNDVDRYTGRCRYEVWAPDGRHFIGGQHSLISATLAEARTDARQETFPCDDECE